MQATTFDRVEKMKIRRVVSRLACRGRFAHYLRRSRAGCEVSNPASLEDHGNYKRPHSHCESGGVCALSYPCSGQMCLFAFAISAVACPAVSFTPLSARSSGANFAASASETFICFFI